METLRWQGNAADGSLMLIDQTLLPTQIQELDCRDIETVWEAIKMLRVRGAPAIGIAAAYGVVVGLQAFRSASRSEFAAKVEEVTDYLATSRPTAVNLFWALDRIKWAAASSTETTTAELHDHLLQTAKDIHQEDRDMCHAIGKHGAALVEDGQGVLTHCNAGGLATAEYGTALSVIFTAQDEGKHLKVYADETRPLLQGARLTMWELMQRGVDATLICDSMAAQVMKEGRISAVITGADRIAANGDSANKIGTYMLAVLAKAHGIPFYIAAPTNTFDLKLPNGDDIPIEQRAAEEITCGLGKQTAPDAAKVYNPAFDVTPAELITAIITERGVIDPVTTDRVRAVVVGEQLVG